MLEKYFLKPSTVDRIRAQWLAPQIEQYVEWMHTNLCAHRSVLRRVPVLCQFADFTARRGIGDLNSAAAQVEDFASEWSARYQARAGSKPCPAYLHEARLPIQHMLRLALEGRIRVDRQHKPYPFSAEASTFWGFLRTERGLRERTIYLYLHSLNRFACYLIVPESLVSGCAASSNQWARTSACSRSSLPAPGSAAAMPKISSSNHCMRPTMATSPSARITPAISE